jgi:ATP-dependent Clp protease ATP-binding subunit ClpC
VVRAAQQEARLANHNYIGTEHLLLALIDQDGGSPGTVLVALHVSPQVIRDRVEQLVPRGGAEPPKGHIPFTPRAKKTLELALRCALEFGHEYIGTEHLLLGMIREGEGVAAQVLLESGVDYDRARRDVVRLLGRADTLPADADGENARLRAEVSRLRQLLERHGIDPDAA